jgi:hypothetical protein
VNTLSESKLILSVNSDTFCTLIGWEILCGSSEVKQMYYVSLQVMSR